MHALFFLLLFLTVSYLHRFKSDCTGLEIVEEREVEKWARWVPTDVYHNCASNKALSKLACRRIGIVNTDLRVISIMA